ncbi:Asp/Glu/hydantoin racemase [Aspergillus ambiguus]|uniref:aspartate/glutamate racemase family protein n=1 Tax=Aspergillus ambiguus TaxID=176160 RepID=UPI003CCE077D
MKTIGIIGGIAWPSTAAYYRTINELTSKRMGGNGVHCAKLVIVQTDLDEVESLEHTGQWDKVGELLGSLASRLQAAGADFFLVACNTVHIVAPQIAAHTTIPMLHIVDATAQKVIEGGHRTVGLLGSRYTMEGTYFSGRLASKYGLDVLVPDGQQQEEIHTALFNQLARGIFLDETRSLFKGVIASLVERGAQVIILGCTEFGLLVREQDSSVPIVDTALAHADAAVQLAIGNATKP